MSEKNPTKLNKTKQNDGLVLDPDSQLSKAALPDPPELLRVQSTEGGGGSPGRAGLATPQC